MTDGGSGAMSTAALAAASDWSVQQVRDLERLGVLGRAERTPAGHRRFTGEHVADLAAYRDLAHAVGPVLARATMRDLRMLPRDEGAATLTDLYAGLARERAQALEARTALESIREEAGSEAAPAPSDVMTITELGAALDVRSSTLRFWESEGLVRPERVPTPSGPARRYDLAAVREARIVAALRAGGYRIPDVRRAVEAVRDLGETAEPAAALDARIEAIAVRTLALLRAGGRLGRIVETV